MFGKIEDRVRRGPGIWIDKEDEVPAELAGKPEEHSAPDRKSGDRYLSQRASGAQNQRRPEHEFVKRVPWKPEQQENGVRNEPGGGNAKGTRRRELTKDSWGEPREIGAAPPHSDGENQQSNEKSRCGHGHPGMKKLEKQPQPAT
jgi:hypothetical protein